MQRHLKLLLILTIISLSSQSFSQKFSSGEKQKIVIELFSSQGCSSCPPAEKFIRDLQKSPKLWKEYIPVVYHIDYWNYIGWSDPFSNKKNTNRQYSHKKNGNVKSVYTPSFIINGGEWKGFFSLKRQLPKLSNKDIGNLEVNIENNKLTAKFSEKSNLDNKSLLLNIVFLGMDIITEIKAGENDGKKVTESFVVLKQTVISPTKVNNKNIFWQVALDKDLKDNFNSKKSEKFAIAVWVSGSNMKPIQAIGGYINL